MNCIYILNMNTFCLRLDEIGSHLSLPSAHRLGLSLHQSIVYILYIVRNTSRENALELCARQQIVWLLKLCVMCVIACVCVFVCIMLPHQDVPVGYLTVAMVS